LRLAACIKAAVKSSIDTIRRSIFDRAVSLLSHIKHLQSKGIFVMSAFYAMNYVGQTGTGGGAVYVGNGKIVGIDVANLLYNGTYTEAGGRLKGTVAMTAPMGGTLVTGARRKAPGDGPFHPDHVWPL
jgi:hypothetical protein